MRLDHGAALRGRRLSGRDAWGIHQGATAAHREPGSARIEPIRKQSTPRSYWVFLSRSPNSSPLGIRDEETRWDALAYFYRPEVPSGRQGPWAIGRAMRDVRGSVPGLPDAF